MNAHRISLAILYVSALVTIISLSAILAGMITGEPILDDWFAVIALISMPTTLMAAYSVAHTAGRDK